MELLYFWFLMICGFLYFYLFFYSIDLFKKIEKFIVYCWFFLNVLNFVYMLKYLRYYYVKKVKYVSYIVIGFLRYGEKIK